MAVARDPCRTRVDDIADARHGERRLGDVRGKHDAALTVRFEHPVLLGRRQPGVQRQDFGLRECELAHGLGGIADFPFSAEKDEHIAGALRGKLLEGLADGLDLIARFGVVRVCERVIDKWPVTDLDRIHATGHLDDRRVVEVAREAQRIDGRRRDDNLQIRTAWQQLLEIAEDEVDVQAALMGFVDDEGVVATELAILLQLGEQDAVGHQLDVRIRGDLVGEPDLVADGFAERRAELLGDPFGHGSRRDATWLGVPDHAAHTPTEFEADLRQLRGLARAGLPRHDHDLVVADRGRDLVLRLDDGQQQRIADRRHPLPPTRDGGFGPLDPGVQFVHARHSTGPRFRLRRPGSHHASLAL